MSSRTALRSADAGIPASWFSSSSISALAIARSISAGVASPSPIVRRTPSIEISIARVGAGIRA